MALSPIDYRMQVGYGSSWHLLRCLGFQRERFNAILSQATGACDITWLDFPAYAGSQTYPKGNPILDNEWSRLDFLGASHRLRAEYDNFWPNSGHQQNWHAVGQATFEGKREWLIVEAKAHTGEIFKTGTGAISQHSIHMIRCAFDATRAALTALGTVDDWLGGYYQYANRLATLYFLNHGGTPARLFLIYFCDDTYHKGNCPADASGWRSTLDDVHRSLGLSRTSDLENRVHEIFVPVDVARAVVRPLNTGNNAMS